MKAMAVPQLRFSLATLLLLTTIACLAVALWATARRLEEAKQRLDEAEAEIEQYRNELGNVTIRDPEALHVIQVAQSEQMQWQWRVYIPEANRFKFHAAIDRIPEEGFSTVYHGAVSLPPGETTIRASVHHNHHGNRVFRVMDVGNRNRSVISTIDIPMEGEHAEWLDSGTWWSEVAGSNGTQSVAVGEGVALVRLRVGSVAEVQREDGKRAMRYDRPDGATQGLMVFITDSKKTTEKPNRANSGGQQ